MTYIEDKLFPPERAAMEPQEDDHAHTPPHGDALAVQRRSSSYHSDDDREVELDEEAYRTW